MARGEPVTGDHGEQEKLAEALVASCPIERRHGLPQAVYRPTIVTLGLVGAAEGIVCLQDNILASRGEREGALGSGNRLFMLTHLVEIVCQKEQDPSQPLRVGEGFSEGLGLTQTRQNTLKIAEREERRAQGEAEIDGLLACVVRLR